MTTREFYETIINLDSIAEELRQKGVELLQAMDDKQNNARKRNSEKRAEELKPFMENIEALLSTAETPKLTTEIATALKLSPNKASAILRKMVTDGVLISIDVKVPKAGIRKAYKLVADDRVQMTDYERNTMY